ncbi:DNA-binding transcriptional regulator, LysR family [Arthrobacter sp. cf158]|uniref:LysR family transcriptional regulator n=1 Tax=Arthrobacter sp. cf158 TaxID=1761744 RepID=UPI00089439BF|nr:LysR family transcriptional regulator [Arthrobacter sp. cf158]SDW89259.1 DNA-binding transcriptional regulator, LysR family [Arthrobacter sp. cf158]
MAEPSTIALRAFVAVAEHLHFTRAAQSLHMTTPALSQQVHRLESLLGAPLFVRSSRRVELSVQGTELLPLAKEAIDAVDRIQYWSNKRLEKVLSVGFVHVGAPDRLAGIFTEVPERLDGARLEFRHIDRDTILGALRDGSIDVAFSWGPNWFDGVTTRTLSTAPRAVLFSANTSRDLIRSSHDQISITQLSSMPFLVPASADERYTSWALADPRPDGSRPKRGPRVHNLDEALAMVVTGLGVCLVPEPVAQAIQHPGVFWATVNDIPAVTFNVCTWQRPASSLGDRFARLVSAEFAQDSTEPDALDAGLPRPAAP